MAITRENKNEEAQELPDQAQVNDDPLPEPQEANPGNNSPNDCDNDGTPEGRLRALQKEMQKQQDENRINSQSAQDHLKKLQELNKEWDEIDKIVSNYSDAREELAEQHDEFVRYSAYKTDKVVADLGDLKDDIDALITHYDECTQAAHDKIDELEPELKKLKREYEDKKEAYAEALKDFIEEKSYQKELEGNFRELEKIKKLIEKEEQEEYHNFKAMYFYMSNYNNILCSEKNTKCEKLANEALLEEEELRTKLTESWNSLLEPLQVLITAEKTIKTKEAELARTKTEYEERKKMRDQQLLKKVNNLNNSGE